MERLEVLCMLSAGDRAAPVGCPRCARVGGLLAAPAGRGVHLPVARASKAVLSHSRERTKGRPVAAKPRQHHGCPRTPRRLAWGRNLMWSAAKTFLAGAAWRGLGVMSLVRWRPGGTVAALVVRGMVGLSGVPQLVGWRGGTGREWSGSPHRCMAGGARAASVGLRRRSPPPSTMTERATLTRSGATVGEPRPSSRNPAPFPGGEGVTAVP